MKKLPIFFMLFFIVFFYSFILATPIVSAASQCKCFCGTNSDINNPDAIVDATANGNSACSTHCSGKSLSANPAMPCTSNMIIPAPAPGGTPAGDCGDGQICLTDPLNINGAGPQVLWARIIQALLFFVGVGALVTFVYAGFMFLTSSGNPEQVKKAKDTMLFAAIGAAVSIGSYTILSYILSILQGASGNY